MTSLAQHPAPASDGPVYDLAIVGGGINGAGIAADAAGRGLKVFLCEQGDFASATSSASSKLVHGGLRYLEHYEFRLVREALAEREVLLAMAPHLVHAQRFVMPHAPHLRPAWMIRAGMFLYDHLGKRTTLPASRQLKLAQEPALRGLLRDEFTKGFEYADCTVDDARLVIANLLGARENGADVRNYTRCESARAVNGIWHLEIASTLGADAHPRTIRARTLVNAAGPWAQQFLEQRAKQKSPYKVRLVQGSHIILPRLHDDPRALIIQNADRRVVFVMPWLDFTVIGTTDREYHGDPSQVAISEEEKLYLLDVANRHFRRTIHPEEVLGSWSGVRPLCDDESSDPSAVTRDYTLSLANDAGAPLLTVFGGKLTTYRRLALAAMEALAPSLTAQGTLPASTTHTRTLPGGDLGGATLAQFADALQADFRWIEPALCRRLAGSYGSRARALLGKASGMADLGEHIGHTMYAREVEFLRSTEWAVTADDILWRRSKLGMYLEAGEQMALRDWLAADTPVRAAKTSVVALATARRMALPAA
jgi:glycerol-3-phosphate dehydrogenase